MMTRYKRGMLLYLLIATAASLCPAVMAIPLSKLSAFPYSAIEELPHCKKITTVDGTVTSQDLTSADISVTTLVQELKLGLSETACFHVQIGSQSANSSSVIETTNNYNETLMYTLQFAELVHHHPIRRRYQFGIPEISTKCICDCPGGDNHCDLSTHLYKNCSTPDPDTVCYRTYHHSQSPTGCAVGTSSELCCDIHIRPYKDWTFWAFQLGQPDTIAVFDYRLYSWLGEGWRKESSNLIQVVLNKGMQDFRLEGTNKLEISVHGTKTFKELHPGMYFQKSGEADIRHDVPVNVFQESEMHRLGWFRKVPSTNLWDIEKGLIKLTAAHHVQVQDCKAQKYTNTYLAGQYVLRGGEHTSEHFNLGKSVELDSHVKKARVLDPETSRYVEVSHSDGTVLTVTLAMENHPKLKFHHHQSTMADFNASIHLDKQSNKYLNVSFTGTRGTLIGTVYHTERRQRVDVVFSTYVGVPFPTTYNTILTLPSAVNSSRWVCFHPSGHPELEKCQLCQYHSERLEWFLVPHKWQSNVGDCTSCNEVAVENFVQYLNPKHWFDGVSSTSETLAIILEIVIYAIVILLIIALVRKCLWPLFSWTFCSKTAPKKV